MCCGGGHSARMGDVVVWLAGAWWTAWARLVMLALVYGASHNKPSQKLSAEDPQISVLGPGNEALTRKAVVFAPKSHLEQAGRFPEVQIDPFMKDGDGGDIPQSLRSLLSRKMCRPQNRDRLLRLLLEGRQGDAETLKSVQRIISKFGNDTVVCKVRHLKGVKLLSNVQSLYSKLGNGNGGLNSRKLRDSVNATNSSHFTCAENTTMLNSTEGVVELQEEMKTRQCLDQTTIRYISRITKLQLTKRSALRSNARRLQRLKCQLAKKYRFCTKRSEGTAGPKTTKAPSGSEELTQAEIHFLNNWPAPYEIKDRGELEMIFY